MTHPVACAGQGPAPGRVQRPHRGSRILPALHGAIRRDISDRHRRRARQGRSRDRAGDRERATVFWQFQGDQQTEDEFWS